jgi:predicted RNase H-like HicB family nuclease
MTYLVRVIPEDEGGYSVLVPGLPGCVSQGETRDEALENVKEAIALYLEVVQESMTEGEAVSVTVDIKVA